MNKWVILTLFYLALAVSLSYESTTWVRLAWLAPIFAIWIASFVVVVCTMWNQRHLPVEDKSPIMSLFQVLPKSWRDWILGENKHRADWKDPHHSK